MKTKTLLVTLIGISFGMKAQNVDLNNSTDYVRIQKNGESGFSRAFGLNSSNHMYIGSVEKTIGNIYFFNKGVNHLMTINPNGNVGIGTITPSARLHIEYLGEGAIISKAKNNGTHGAANIIVDAAFNYPGRFLFRENGLNKGWLDYYAGKFSIKNNSNTSLFTVMADNGNIGIGTTNPNGWKLAVNGKIRAKEIKIETGWSDFVFQNDYKLPSLKEVEKHIEEKGHLKDIPSAKDVEKNGVFLGEMDSKLLQKIEELTLYTIQQEKKIKEQAEKIENLESLNKKFIDLQKRLEKLENK